MRFYIFIFFLFQCSSLFAILSNDDPASKQAIIATLGDKRVHDVDIQITPHKGKYCSAIYFIILKDAAGCALETIVAKEFSKNDDFETEKKRYEGLKPFLENSYDNTHQDLPYLVPYLGSFVYGHEGVLLFEQAQGIRFCDYLETLLIMENEDAAKKTIARVAETLFAFQKYFWDQNKDFYHGDFNAGNIFIDIKTLRISWIDYENMWLCLNPPKPQNDDYAHFDRDLKGVLNQMVGADKGKRHWRRWVLISHVRKIYGDLMQAYSAEQAKKMQALFEGKA